MSNPLLALIKQHAGAFLARLKQFAFGVAEDFWKDGSAGKDVDVFASAIAAAGAASAGPAGSKYVWHALPGEISEKMWGEEFTAPRTAVVAQGLTAPLELNKESSILDLSAGLGGEMKALVETYGASITGLESDAGIAARGKELIGKNKHISLAPYDLNHFSSTHKYDSIIAREVFYRVTDKDKYVAAIAAAAKPKAHIAFTDYIVNPEDREKPAIAGWQAFETEAAPLSLVEVAEVWARAGFTIRIHDDQTTAYKKEVMAGLKRFAMALASTHKPDAETKKAIMHHIQIWVHRVAAMEQGMKFFRFHGTRP